MLFTIGNYEVKVNRNRKSGSEFEKTNQNYNRSRAAEAFALTNLVETHRNITVGRIF